MRAKGIILVIAVSCSTPTRHGGGDDDTTTDGNLGTTGDASADDCSDASKLVYVIDEFSNHLSRFDPSTRTFTDLGALACPTMAGATPFSMGVDRTATAWVLYDSGELFHVDTTTLACTKTTWTSQAGLTVFGMGFSTDQAGGTTDSLFIGGGASQTQSSFTLARVDPTTMVATPIGPEPLLPEMTGNGAGELWGFFPGTSDATIQQIDKSTGSAMKTFDESSLAGSGAGYAFAFWGGDFWVFLIRSGDTESKVYQVDGMTGGIKGTTSSNGRTIVGAGVSTCAPVVIL